MDLKLNVVYTWEEYKVPPINPSKEWWADTIYSALHPPTMEDIQRGKKDFCKNA